MPEGLDWKRLLETGKGFAEQRTSRVRQLASEFVARADVATGQASASVEDLMELSRRRTEELGQTVRGEVQRQLSAVGVATKDDLVTETRRANDQVSASVEELVELSRRRTGELGKTVAEEVQRQLNALDLATKDDVVALERRLSALATKDDVIALELRLTPAATSSSERRATESRGEQTSRRDDGSQPGHVEQTH
jgi:polyhydroxyalkanoate synthesis regulator phasin